MGHDHAEDLVLMQIMVEVILTPEGNQRTRMRLSQEEDPGVIIQHLELAKLAVFTNGFGEC